MAEDFGLSAENDLQQGRHRTACHVETARLFSSQAARAIESPISKLRSARHAGRTDMSFPVVDLPKHTARRSAPVRRDDRVTAAAAAAVTEHYPPEGLEQEEGREKSFHAVASTTGDDQLHRRSDHGCSGAQADAVTSGRGTRSIRRVE